MCFCFSIAFLSLTSHRPEFVAIHRARRVSERAERERERAERRVTRRTHVVVVEDARRDSRGRTPPSSPTARAAHGHASPFSFQLRRTRTSCVRKQRVRALRCLGGNENAKRRKQVQKVQLKRTDPPLRRRVGASGSPDFTRVDQTRDDESEDELERSFGKDSPSLPATTTDPSTRHWDRS